MARIDLALATGIDVPIPECQLSVHQPTIKEISYLGEQEYFTALQCACIKIKEDMPKELENNFQLFMLIMTDKQSAAQKALVLSAFALWFKDYKVQLTPRAILLNKKDDNIIIDENNFSFLQETLRHIGCLVGKAEDTFNPSNEAAAEIARKLQRGRERVAAQRKAENNPNDASILGQYMSILAVGLGKSMTELINLTVYQLYDLMERFGLYEAYDLDIKQRLAGGKPDSQPENWKKIIH